MILGGLPLGNVNGGGFRGISVHFSVPLKNKKNYSKSTVKSRLSIHRIRINNQRQVES